MSETQILRQNAYNLSSDGFTPSVDSYWKILGKHYSGQVDKNLKISFDTIKSDKSTYVCYATLKIDNEILIRFSESIPNTTKHIAEFLCIVDTLKHVKKHRINCVIHSADKIAINWVDNNNCSAKIKYEHLTKNTLRRIELAEKWLKKNPSKQNNQRRNRQQRIIKSEGKQHGF